MLGSFLAIWLVITAVVSSSFNFEQKSFFTESPLDQSTNNDLLLGYSAVNNAAHGNLHTCWVFADLLDVKVVRIAFIQFAKYFKTFN